MKLVHTGRHKLFESRIVYREFTTCNSELLRFLLDRSREIEGDCVIVLVLERHFSLQK